MLLGTEDRLGMQTRILSDIDEVNPSGTPASIRSSGAQSERIEERREGMLACRRG